MNPSPVQCSTQLHPNCYLSFADLARGRDGYSAFAGPDVTMLASEEEGPILPMLVRNHFRILAALSALPATAEHRGTTHVDTVEAPTSLDDGGIDPRHAMSPAATGSRSRPRAKGLRRVPWPAAGDAARPTTQDVTVTADKVESSSGARRTLLAVAPARDGRIRIVGHSDWDPIVPTPVAGDAAPR